MKNHILRLLALLCCSGSIEGYCQGLRMQMFAIEPYPLEVTVRKTTHLVFPYPIISVDRGSADILAQKAKGAGNILQVKAAREEIAQTSLTVITADGKLYGFLAGYHPEPSQLNIEFAGEDIARAQLTAEGGNQVTTERLAKAAATENSSPGSSVTANSGVQLEVCGPFIGQQMMFFRMLLSNETDISYHIESLRFFIQEKKKARRSAVQQQEIKPVYVLNDTAVVAGRSAHQLVFAFRQFTIPAQKYLAIQAGEEGGSRQLSLRVPAKRITRPVPLE